MRLITNKGKFFLASSVFIILLGCHSNPDEDEQELNKNHPFSIVVDKGNVISYADAWLMLNTLPESAAVKTLAAATSTMFFLVLKNTLPTFNYFFSY